jgi:hypothetical protein
MRSWSSALKMDAVCSPKSWYLTRSQHGVAAEEDQHRHLRLENLKSLKSCSFFSVRKFHTHKTQQVKIIVLQSFIFGCLIWGRKVNGTLMSLPVCFNTCSHITDMCLQRWPDWYGVCLFCHVSLSHFVFLLENSGPTCRYLWRGSVYFQHFTLRNQLHFCRSRMWIREERK